MADCTAYPEQRGIGEIDIAGKMVRVYCDKGWTVIQSRGQFGNAKDYFYRNWTEYVNGFGEPGKEHWLGLESIHKMTSSGQNYKLKVEMTGTAPTYAKQRKIAEYAEFRLESNKTDYKLFGG